MKNLLFITLFFNSLTFFGQVGIGTIQPEETLHVNGTFRVNTTNQPNINTNKIAGLNEKGNMHDVTIGTNLTLQNNILSASSSANNYSFGSIILSAKDNNNVDLLIGAGQLNDGKTIIKIYNVLLGDTNITGIKAGFDGQHLWVYPQDGKIELKSNDNNSTIFNRIEKNDKNSGERYCMIEIVYDATRGKWIIMQNHG